MKKILFLLLLFVGASAYGQTNTNSTDSLRPEPLSFVDEMPQYPGGDNALQKEIAKSMEYPKEERKNNKEGTVYISFIVETDGSITNVEVERGVKDAPGLGIEAVRAIKNLKHKFSPPKHQGKPARFRMLIPVKFKL